MITITIPARDSEEFWDPVKEEFITTEPIQETKIDLEHSLVAISKWESKWKKAFLKKDNKTSEELLDYVRCMALNDNISDKVYSYIPQSEFERITAYIEDRMSATYVTKRPEDNKPSKDTVTSELIYYWMIANQIPFECQYWHINRLMALIQVCSVKNAAMYGGKKNKGVNTQSLLKHNAALNASRRAKLGTKG